jgi:hypothetical protein
MEASHWVSDEEWFGQEGTLESVQSRARDSPQELLVYLGSGVDQAIHSQMFSKGKGQHVKRLFHIDSIAFVHSSCEHAAHAKHVPWGGETFPALLTCQHLVKDHLEWGHHNPYLSYWAVDVLPQGLPVLVLAEAAEVRAVLGRKTTED